jgi:hypothetical protein
MRTIIARELPNNIDMLLSVKHAVLIARWSQQVPLTYVCLTWRDDSTVSGERRQGADIACW